jgi:hypothetical protein
VYDTLVDDVLQRATVQGGTAPVYVLNLHTKDSHEEAAIAAAHAFQLVSMVWQTAHRRMSGITEFIVCADKRR